LKKLIITAALVGIVTPAIAAEPAFPSFSAMHINSVTVTTNTAGQITRISGNASFTIPGIPGSTTVGGIGANIGHDASGNPTLDTSQLPKLPVLPH